MSHTTVLAPAVLQDRLAKSDWLVFDCRFSLDRPQRGRDDYLSGHVPGAHYAHLDEHLAAPRGPETGRHPLPQLQRLVTWLRRAGLDNRQQVVVYDDAGGAYASRLWWMLRWLGHDAVTVLDGGWQAWQAAGYPVSARPPQPRPGHFVPAPRQQAWISSAELAGLVATGGVRLIDARTPERFTGDTEPIDPVAGHIPRAVNLPYTGNLDQRGHFLARDRLHERFADLARPNPASPIVHMCGSGVTACHNILAMERAGLPGGRLYVGSWSEWITDPLRPVVAPGA